MIQSVAVLGDEIERCKKILPNLDGELLEAMNGRIELLDMAKDSIESDIQCEMLDVAGYLDQIKQYLKEESANY